MAAAAFTVPQDPGSSSPRKIIHIDMDAFFASVEQRDNPNLRGLPVAVGGSRARGVVAAASYEARVFGIRSAMASATAIRRCPDLIFVKPRFEVYKAVSRQIRAIFAAFTPLIEPLSLDEAYLDVTAALATPPSSGAPRSATAVAEEIRCRILAETGLTASAGVSYNKFLAKLASDHRKPNGLFVIPPSKGAAFVETLDVARFHGIGPVTAARMKSLGIATGRDLRAQSQDFLDRHFGKSGRYYYLASRGIDHRPVSPDRIRKSIGSETTFATDLTRGEELVEGLRPAIDTLWTYCRSHPGSGRTVTLKVKYADFKQVTRSRTGAVAVSSREDLERTSEALIACLLPLRAPVRLVGLSLSNLEDGDVRPVEQLTLPL